MQSRTGLILENIKIRLGGRQLLAIHAQAEPGAVLTVMGPSGSGKSTLLAYLGGFIDPAFTAEGRVLLDGNDLTALPAEDRHAGVLFQDPLLFPHFSVEGNLTFAIPEQIRDRRQRRAMAGQMLAEMELAEYAQKDPDTLSGGQKARVALARALLSAPKFLLLDEPFSRLDADLRQQIRELVFLRIRERGLPAVLVTHDQEDADAAGGPILRIGEAAA